MIPAIAASLLLVIAGWPLAGWLDPEARPAGRRLGEAYLLGTGTAGALLLAFSLLQLPWSRPLLLVALLLLTAIGVMAGRGRSRAGFSSRPIRLHWIDLVTLLLIAGYARFATRAPTIEYDFIGIWGVKARQFFFVHGVDWRFLENPFNEFAHVDYPLLVPLAFDHYAIVAGVWADRWLGVANVCFGLSALLIVRGWIEEETGSTMLVSMATLAMVSSALSPWIGLAEGPLVAYGAAGVLYVRRGLRRGVEGGESDVVRGAAFLAGAAMCKNEGLTLLVAVATGVVVARGHRLLPRLWPAGLVAGTWMVLRATHHLHGDLTSGSMGSRAWEHLSNLRPMIEAMQRYPLGRPLFWTGIVAALLLGARRIALRERFLASAIIVQLLFFLAAYLITPHDVAWHVRWSWERILQQLTILIVFLALTGLLPSMEATVVRVRSGEGRSGSQAGEGGIADS